jgi:hypothetical protein
MLRLDKVFQKIAWLDDHPVQSTISRFLKRFRVDTAKGIAGVNHCLLMKAKRDLEGWHIITLDLDSHMRTTYGLQQRASMGYNSKNAGETKYSSLIVLYRRNQRFFLISGKLVSSGRSLY